MNNTILFNFKVDTNKLMYGYYYLNYNLAESFISDCINQRALTINIFNASYFICRQINDYIIMYL